MDIIPRALKNGGENTQETINRSLAQISKLDDQMGK
jgi:hypothetical protein